MTKLEELKVEYLKNHHDNLARCGDVIEGIEIGYNESKAEILFLQTTINNMKADRETLFQEFTDTLIKNDGLVLKTEYDKLKAQIEKMKCDKNCIRNWQTNGKCVFDCGGGYCPCDFWELNG